MALAHRRLLGEILKANQIREMVFNVMQDFTNAPFVACRYRPEFRLPTDDLADDDLEDSSHEFLHLELVWPGGDRAGACQQR